MEDNIVYTFPAELLLPACRLEVQDGLWAAYDIAVRNTMKRYGIDYSERDRAEAIVRDAMKAAEETPLCWVLRKFKMLTPSVLYFVERGDDLWVITMDVNGWIIVKRIKYNMHEIVSMIQYVAGCNGAKIVVIGRDGKEIRYPLLCRYRHLQ